MGQSPLTSELESKCIGMITGTSKMGHFEMEKHMEVGRRTMERTTNRYNMVSDMSMLHSIRMIISNFRFPAP